jgi:hypothetical protein
MAKYYIFFLKKEDILMTLTDFEEPKIFLISKINYVGLQIESA